MLPVTILDILVKTSWGYSLMNFDDVGTIGRSVTPLCLESVEHGHEQNTFLGVD